MRKLEEDRGAVISAGAKKALATAIKQAKASSAVK